jgi:hypothetical protein
MFFVCFLRLLFCQVLVGKAKTPPSFSEDVEAISQFILYGMYVITWEESMFLQIKERISGLKKSVKKLDVIPEGIQGSSDLNLSPPSWSERPRRTYGNWQGLTQQWCVLSGLHNLRV